MMPKMNLLTAVLCSSLLEFSGVAQAAPERRSPQYAHRSAVLSVAFSRDGTILASASKDKTVKLWNTADGSLRAELPAFKDRVSAVAFSPTEDVLATVC